LLLVARARAGAGSVAGPPWPLARDEVMRLASFGLRAEAVDEVVADGAPHWRALFRR
jgi:hypothetical protein